MSDIEYLDDNQAGQIIEDLKNGVPPMDYVQYFTVGREIWIDGINYYLQKYIKKGGSTVKFVNGNYGDGKTHFMSLIRKYGFDENYAVSFVNLDRIRPNKFEEFYAHIISNIAVQEKQKDCGIKGVFDLWYKTHSSKSREELSEEIEKIRNVDAMNEQFKNAVISYLKGLADIKPLDWDEKSYLIQWLEGTKISKKLLKNFGIFLHVDKSNSRNMLKSLVAFLHHIGYSGLIILIDEIESIMTESRGATRDGAYENIRQIIDNTDHCSYMLFVGAITPASVDNANENHASKNLVSYDALWSRIEPVIESERLNKRATIIDLVRTPLNKDNFFEIALKIRDIHAKAFDWDPQNQITNDFLKLLSEKVHGGSYAYAIGLSPLRVMIKTTIDYLEAAESDDKYIPTIDKIEQEVIMAAKSLEKHDEGEREHKKRELKEKIDS